MVSDFRHEVDQNRALLHYYAASSSNFLPTVRDPVTVPISGVYKKDWGPQ